MSRQKEDEMSQAGESFAAGAGVRGLAGQSNSNFDHTSFGVAHSPGARANTIIANRNG